MKPVVLFDGECNFCDSSVQFIIKRDEKEVFQFASLQSEAGEQLLEKFKVPAGVDSMILIENSKVYCKSAAALRICRSLQGAWKLVYLLIVVPRPIGDLLYDFIARNRYKWFGKKDSCMLPPPHIRKRFL